MKRLILMRHAKSDWSSRAATDHDRPLNARGRHSAEALGDFLRDNDLLPDQVLSSSAKRTGETLLRLKLPEKTDVTFSRDLYLATHNDMMSALQGATGQTVLMVGHNPGMRITAGEILAEPPVGSPQFDKYPTGSTLVADFDIDDWAQADWGMAQLAHFVSPRELL